MVKPRPNRAMLASSQFAVSALAQTSDASLNGPRKTPGHLEG